MEDLSQNPGQEKSKVMSFFDKKTIGTIVFFVIVILILLFQRSCSGLFDRLDQMDKTDSTLMEKSKCCAANSDSITVHRTEIDKFKVWQNVQDTRITEIANSLKSLKAKPVILERKIVATTPAPQAYRKRTRTGYVATSPAPVAVQSVPQNQGSSSTTIDQNEINRRTIYNNKVNKKKIYRGGANGDDEEVDGGDDGGGDEADVATDEGE